MSSENTSDYRKVALEFTKLLAAREYTNAYAMTSQEYRKRNTVDRLRTAFETIVPADWGTTGPIEVGQTMTSWPGKHSLTLAGPTSASGETHTARRSLSLLHRKTENQEFVRWNYDRP